MSISRQEIFSQACIVEGYGNIATRNLILGFLNLSNSRSETWW